jgi:hypothetical protein
LVGNKNSIIKDYFSSDNDKYPFVSIETDFRRYAFSLGLNEAEIDWLNQ